MPRAKNGEIFSEWFAAKITEVGATTGTPPCDATPHGWTTLQACPGQEKYKDPVAGYPVVTGSPTKMPAYALDGSAAGVGDLVLMRQRNLDNNGNPVMEFVVTTPSSNAAAAKRMLKQRVADTKCVDGRLKILLVNEAYQAVNDSFGAAWQRVPDYDAYSVKTEGCCDCGGSSSGSNRSGSFVSGSGSGTGCVAPCFDVLKNAGICANPPCVEYFYLTLNIDSSACAESGAISGSGSVSGVAPISYGIAPDSFSGDSGSVSGSGSAPCIPPSAANNCGLPASLSLRMACWQFASTVQNLVMDDPDHPDNFASIGLNNPFTIDGGPAYSFSVQGKLASGRRWSINGTLKVDSCSPFSMSVVGPVGVGLMHDYMPGTCDYGPFVDTQCYEPAYGNSTCVSVIATVTT